LKLKQISKRQQQWEEILRNPLPDTIPEVARLLAMQEIEVDEDGTPNWVIPPMPKMNPLVYLYALEKRIYKNDEGAKTDPLGKRYDEQIFTRAWKADLLTAATLVWGEAIELNNASIKANFPTTNINKSDVVFLLHFCDLDEFWAGPGKGKKRADVKTDYTDQGRWDRSMFLVTEEKLYDMMRKKK
jgi:hypothetical protein